MPAPRRRLGAAPAADTDRMRQWFDAIRAEHEVADHGPEALAEGDEAALAPVGPDLDLTEVPFVTLDPPGSTDLDQALHLSRTRRGYLVRYAIADVAAFVRPGGALDRAARARGTTVYCPDRRVPLHPVVLSEGAASLLPDGRRPAVVWTIELDRDAGIGSARVERAWVRSRARLDYPAQQSRLSGGTADDVIALLAEVGRLLREREVARGGVSLGRPEQEVVGGPHGWDLVMRSPLPIEEHNAQISLLTGMVAARMMLDAGVGVLRTMPPAGRRDLERLRRQALALGLDWLAARPYPEVLATLDRARPEVAAFLVEATRLFRGAAWTPFDGTPPAEPVHGAVGAPYAHVTAPLRRLVDRFGTEVCLAVGAGVAVPAWVREAFGDLGQEMARGAARAGAVDRACTDLVEAAVLEPRVGEDFAGVVVDEGTVQLADPAVVARAEDAVVQGSRVRVRLLTADPATRSVRFRVLAGT